MSRSLNRVTLLGHVGGDPEIRTTQGGGKVAQFSLATSNQWNDSQGQKQEKTAWHRCVIWNTKYSTLADLAEKYVTKGSKLYVEGEIEYRQWQDKDGQTRYTTEIKVRELILLGTKGGAEDDGSKRDLYPRNDKPAPVRSAKSAAPADNFDDFPGALDGDDDDLPF